MTHAEARRIVEAAFRGVHGRSPSPSEVTYIQAVAWLENQYGRAGQFARFAAQGTYNWGSLHARGSPPDCPPGSAPGFDQGNVCFQVFDSDEAAAAAFVRVLTKQRPSVLAAMRGTPEDVAHAMKATGYYTAPEGAYAAAIRNAARTVGGTVPTVTRGNVLFWAAVTGAGYYAYREGWLDELFRSLRRAL